MIPAQKMSHHLDLWCSDRLWYSLVAEVQEVDLFDGIQGSLLGGIDRWCAMLFHWNSHHGHWCNNPSLLLTTKVSVSHSSWDRSQVSFWIIKIWIIQGIQHPTTTSYITPSTPLSNQGLQTDAFQTRFPLETSCLSWSQSVSPWIKGRRSKYIVHADPFYT